MKAVGNELFGQYDISIKKYQYNRSNYYLETKQGILLLRKVLVPKEQIYFQYEVTEQLLQKGFQALDKMYLTKKQSPFVLSQDRTYVLQSYDKTAEIDFTNEKELYVLVELLGQFHAVGHHIQSETREVDSVSIKNVYEYFQKRVLDARRMRKTISKLSQKTKFEVMFMNDYRPYEDLEELALEFMTADLSSKLIEKARKEKTIVHNEYTYHAVGYRENKGYVINNLDACTYNIQIIDLVNVLTKVMQKNNWDIRLLNRLLEHYGKYHTLNTDEVNALKAMLIFPEKYATLCYKYTMSKRRNHYSMFEHKWENMLDYKDKQIQTAKEIAKFL